MLNQELQEESNTESTGPTTVTSIRVNANLRKEFEELSDISLSKLVNLTMTEYINTKKANKKVTNLFGEVFTLDQYLDQRLDK